MVRQQPFREIAREIERRIRQGVYPENSALPSRPELAEEFGIGVVSGAEFMEYAGSIFDAVFLNPAKLENRSAWRRLFEFDGLLWGRPEAVLFPAIEAIAPQVPSVLINRVVADLPYVSSDHRRAYYEITRSRIAAYPETLPVLLQSRPDSLVTGCRYEVFREGCHAGRTPETLERTSAAGGSDTRARTGFDNDFDTDIFGVRVTGFLQDQELLFKEAAAKLKRTLNGTPDAEPGLQVYPEFRDADT